MTLNIQSAPEEARIALELVAEDLGLRLDPSGVLLRLQPAGAGLCLSGSRSGEIILEYDSLSNLCRGLSRLRSFQGGEIRETRAFRDFGVMIDCSRNAVPTVDTVKLFLRSIALMGYSTLMLYMEDSYEVPGLPYFGHLRGRFSQEELRQIDDYAARLGVEVVPCIQTLAHLQRYLLWPQNHDLTDTPEILLVGEERVYEFLEKLLRAASAPFRSRRIHVGMDEAHGLGLGHYLSKHGYQDRFEILNQHLDRVAAIVSGLGKESIMWSDMFFRLSDPSADYAAEHVPAEVAQRIPDEVQLVYWDYFSDDIEFYRRKICQHEAMKPGCMFAGGIWTWNGLGYNHSRTALTTVPAIAACREEGVQSVLMTMWGDDGQEIPILQGLYGLQMSAELAYAPTTLPTHPKDIDFAAISARFTETLSSDAAPFIALDRIDNLSGNPWSDRSATTGKQALFQDLLMGLFDRHIDGIGAGSHYASLSLEFEAAFGGHGRFHSLFEAPAALCRVLELKAELGLKLKKLYDTGDRSGLKDAISLIRRTQARLEHFHLCYRKQWLTFFKPFGYEVIDTRLGGLRSRLDYAVWRIEEYLAGKISSIPELETDRLFFDGREEATSPADAQIRFQYWHRMITTGYIGHNLY